MARPAKEPVVGREQRVGRRIFSTRQVKRTVAEALKPACAQERRIGEDDSFCSSGEQPGNPGARFAVGIAKNLRLQNLAFNTTRMLDRICKKYNRELIEHGIGFKFVCDYMLEREILMGGEESGGIGFQRHLPERDGLLNSLLLANVMAEEGKTLGQLVADLQAEYGEHQYGRVDLHIPDAIKNAAIARSRALPAGDTTFAGMPILRTETLDGVKFYLDNPDAGTRPNAAETWLLLRASGTEPLMRIYTESCSKESVAKLLESARAFALGG